MDTIKLSVNELSALLRRLFEWLYAGANDNDEYGQMIVWLETRKLPGVAWLIDALPALRRRPTSTPSLHETSGTLIIEAGGCSLLEFACGAADLAIARARTAGSGHVRIVDALHTWAMAPCVARCGASGLACAAWWPGAETGSTIIAWLAIGQAQPDIGITRRGTPPAHVELLCSTNDAQLIANLDDVFGAGSCERFESIARGEDLAQRNAACVDGGVAIDAAAYAILCATADQILVHSSDASRRGAGD